MEQSVLGTLIYPRPKRPSDRYALPGFGLPLDYVPLKPNVYGVDCRSVFPTLLSDRHVELGYVDQPLLTLREIGMLGVMEEITDIPEWWKKIHDPLTADKWKSIALKGPNDITPKMADWIIDELLYKAISYEYLDLVTLYNGNIVKSDTAASQSLLFKLRQAFTRLDTPDQSETIPRTKGLERDVVPISYYPFVYGRSCILKDRVIGLDDAISAIGEGDIIPRPEEPKILKARMSWLIASRADVVARPYSTRFQLLPCDVQLGADGKWHISSYINNLHPVRFRELYGLLDELINCLIPLFNACLSPLNGPILPRRRINYNRAQYQPLSDIAKQQKPIRKENEDETEFQERLKAWRWQHYKPVQPDAGRFEPLALPKFAVQRIQEMGELLEVASVEEGVDLQRDYSSSGLQMIIRFIAVELNLEEPYFEVPWHVEGQMNEHIVAMAFYFIDWENLDDGWFYWRHISDTTGVNIIEHEPNDWIWLKEVFGLEPGAPAVQETAKTKIRSGRIIVFPNVVQHSVKPMKLKDPTKNGRTRVIVLFLVDPNLRIISTANVPPQRVDWTPEWEELQTHADELDQIPPKLRERAVSRGNGCSIPPQEASQFREDMWRERQDFKLYNDATIFSRIVPGDDV